MTDAEKNVLGLVFVCSAAVCAWMVLFNIRPIQDPDIWWHLASGRYMVTHGEIPRTDVFSLTARGTTWVNTYWLQDVCISLLVQAGGIRALTFINAMAIAAIVFMIGCSNPAGGLSWPTRLLGIVWIFLAGQPRGYGWEEKASLITFAFLGLLFHALRAPHWTSQKRWMTAWPFLFILWANLHRGFLLGLLIVSAYGLEKWISSPKERPRLALWWLACVAATFINPWGFRVYGMGWQDYRLSPINVTGWAQTPFFHLEFFWLTLVFFCGVVVWQIRNKRTLGLGFLLTSLLLGGISIRYASFYRYFVAWAVPWLLAVINERTAFLEKTKMLPWMILFMPVSSLNLKPAFGINEHIFPIRAVEFLKENDLRTPFFHEYELGGFYLWALEGKPPVLIDGRYPAVEGYRKLLPEIQRAIQGTPPEFHRFLDHFGIHSAVVKYPSTAFLPAPFSIYFPRREWALIYWDDVVLIFVQRTTPFQTMIRNNEFAAIEPDAAPLYWKKNVWEHASENEKRQIREAFDRNVRLHPESSKARLWLDIISR